MDSRNVIEAFQLAATPHQKNREHLKEIEQFNVEIIIS